MTITITITQLVLFVLIMFPFLIWAGWRLNTSFEKFTLQRTLKRLNAQLDLIAESHTGDAYQVISTMFFANKWCEKNANEIEKAMDFFSGVSDVQVFPFDLIDESEKAEKPTACPNCGNPGIHACTGAKAK